MKQKLVAMVLFTVMTIALPLPALSKTPLKEQATHDPLFAIVYLSSKVKFEPAPEAIFICEDLRKPRRKLSLFGKTTRSGTDFYYVFGRVEVDNGAGPTGEFETQNDDGIIVALSPEGCRDIGAGYALSSDPRFVVPLAFHGPRNADITPPARTISAFSVLSERGDA